ncbi:MAG: hypothetical protein GY906_37100 [bacterium]|nr:hypothetical protein [bacterium]
MGIRIQPTQFARGEVPDTQNYPVEAATSFLRGSPVDADASGDLIEHPGGSTVTGIVGFSLEEAVSGAGLGPTGRVGVAKAGEKQIYLCQAVAAAAGAIMTDLSSFIVGEQYGMVKSTAAATLGEWFLDQGDTTDVVFQVTKIDDNLNTLWVFVIPSAVRPF